MANQHDIKNYLLDKEDAYFKQDNRNGEILMLSGVWGSGKTYFWKEELENELIKTLKDNKSYVYISLYGHDSLEELQNEIQQVSYHFSKENRKDVISFTYNVFTKVASFIPKVSFNAFGIGVEVEADRTVQQLEEENIKQQIKQGVGRLEDGGIICFDDFERKSSKIDLNDLFGFITNLTETFKTKTVIITNQEFFKDNDNEVFSRIKEKSVNKFLLLDPTVDELFETIYTEKYSDLDEYKEKILEAIKITEEKNARIFIQVLDNCLEYKELIEDKQDMFLLVIVTILFVKYNIIFEMENYNKGFGEAYLPRIVKHASENIVYHMWRMKRVQSLFAESKHQFVNILIKEVESNSKDAQRESVKKDIIFIEENQNKFYQVYKYAFIKNYFYDCNQRTLEKMNNFVESGILPNE
ncbi:P-loop NTPase fold protein [Sulfurimonas sp.]|uniref:P-loop NTPase fold protein n=1 Tax=Sulfurimonas sp. TaxID=2022749 RepID=UPI003565F65A